MSIKCGNCDYFEDNDAGGGYCCEYDCLRDYSDTCVDSSDWNNEE